MTGQTSFTVDEARHVGEQIGIDWVSAPFDVDQFRIGMDVELEHGTRDAATNVTDDDVTVTAPCDRRMMSVPPVAGLENASWPVPVIDIEV